MDPARAAFVRDDIADAIADRLAFVRHAPERTLVIGSVSAQLTEALCTSDVTHYAEVDAADELFPFATDSFDLIVWADGLSTMNDVAGALVQCRLMLRSGGLLVGAFPGDGALPVLRRIMASADGDRAAPRMHPQIDVATMGALLQRAGMVDPVVAVETMDVRYRALASLIGDVRALGWGNALAGPTYAIRREGWRRAQAAFAAQAEADGRVTEQFRIVHFAGWRSRPTG